MAPPSASPVEAVAPLFETERARLLDLLKSLDEQDWQRPSPCPGWTVLGLASHLLGGDLGLLSRQRDNYMGTPSPEGLAESEFVGWLDQLSEYWIHRQQLLEAVARPVDLDPALLGPILQGLRWAY